ncbi:hypothetical protein I4U23_015263 [Adineta vaga]|nr:hypothetical protein I4U23_015263 [Adineta vaga]
MDDYENAIDYGQRALSIRKAVFPDNHPIFPLTYNELADFYEENHQYDLAIEYYMKSMNDSLEMKRMIYLNIARCYGLMKQFDISRLHFEKVLEIEEKILPCDEMKLAEVHEKIALCFWSEKIYDLTILHYQMALDLRKKIVANKIEIIQLYKRIGTCYDEKQEYELAIEKIINMLWKYRKKFFHRL